MALRAEGGDALCLVELRGFEPLIPCMPCSFSAVRSPRSGVVSQLRGPIRLTVTDRYVPLVTAAYGTRMARPASTTMLVSDGEGSQVVRCVGPSPRRPLPHWQEPRRLAAAWAAELGSAPTVAEAPALRVDCAQLLGLRPRRPYCRFSTNRRTAWSISSPASSTSSM
jgi:hypothetical protein